MSLKHFLELVLLSALWGASFLFMRVGAPEFGPVALIELRAAIAAITLLPLLVVSGQLRQVWDNLSIVLVIGVTSTALPFCLLSYATLYVSAAYASILNATAPIFTAIVAWLWVNDRLSLTGYLGLVIGFIGVFVLVLDDDLNSADTRIIPVLAGLGATFCYGIAANFSRQKMGHMPPLAIAGGSQMVAALILLPFSIWLWPEQNPTTLAWVSVVILGVASTGLAFIIYFRLIAAVGVHKTMAVTYLIPLFSMLWGYLIISEQVTLIMLGGGLLILFGVSLTTGLLQGFLGLRSKS